MVKPVDTREQLVAYVEGTLTPEQRLQVVRRLAHSPFWQRELEKLHQTDDQLRREMPVFGRPQQTQLQALLPTILAQSQPALCGESWWGKLRASLLVAGTLAVLVMVPLLLNSASADAGGKWSPNVPHSTATQAAQSRESTEEAPARLVYEDISAQREARASMAFVRWAASPAPMPGATAEPSRAASGQRR